MGNFEFPISTLKRSLIRFVLLSLLLVVFPVFAQDAETTEEAEPPVLGNVIGRVTNGSATGSVPADLTVTLLVSDGESLQQTDTVMQPDGSFAFADIPLYKDYQYFTMVIYRDRQFFSDVQVIESATDTLNMPITIYELTEDPAVVSISEMVIRIVPLELDGIGTGLEILQVIAYQNRSDRMYTTSQNLGSGQYRSLWISLPPGSVVLGMDDAQRYMLTEDQSALIDTLPVMPGENHSVQVTYYLPYEDGAIIEQALDNPLTGKVRLLLADNLELTGDQLTYSGTQTSEDRSYKVYEGTVALAAGEAFQYELTGSMTTQAAFLLPQDSWLPLLMIAILVLLVMLAALVYFLGRRGRMSKDTMIEALTRQVTALEAQHEAGEINHDLYHHRRKALQSRLKALMDSEKER